MTTAEFKDETVRSARDPELVEARARLAAPDAEQTQGLPLHGLLVLDLTLARAGPTCVRHLADWGANIIRIQPPDDGTEEVIGGRDGSDYQNLHRNKRVITLNLKTAQGYEALLRLVRVADVLVENMRVNVKHRLKIAYEDLKAVNPRLVYGSISGFGQTGPYAERPGVDQIVQGMSGIMSVTGEPGGEPTRAGIAVADLTSGNHLALAIMMALYARERTGEGAWVHTSLLEGAVFMMDFQASRFLLKKEVPRQVGNIHPTAVPTGVFRTTDGRVSVGASATRQFKGLCAALGHPEWAQAAKWKSQEGRAADRDALLAAIASSISGHSTAHWVDTLNAAGIPCGPVYTVDQMFDDPQVRHIGIAAPIDHPTYGKAHLVASPINVHGASKKIRSLAHATGVHTEEILTALGYSGEQVEKMRAARAV